MAQLDKHGSLQYTLRTLKGLEKGIHEELARVEQESSSKNWIMRLLIHKLIV